MKSFKVIFIIFISLTIINNHEIIELNKENIGLFNESKYSIAYFYKKNLEHHEYILEEFKKSFEISKQQNLPFKFFTINVSKYAKITESNINPPEIKIYWDKKITQYDGPYEHKKIIRYLHKEIEGPIYKANSILEIDNFKNEYELPFVLISTINENNSEYESFKEFTILNGGFSDSINCISEECINEYGKNTVILLKNYDGKQVKLNGKISLDSINDLIKEHSLEIGGNLNKNSFTIITHYNLSSVIYFRDENNENEKKIDEIIKDLGNQKFQSYKYFTSDIKGNQFYKELSEFFLLSEKDLPTIEIFDPLKYYNYQIKTKELTREKIEEFIRGVKEGKIERELNSDEIPEKDIYSFNTIVGKTFKKIVLESKKPYLVIFIKNNKKICPKCLEAAKAFQTLSNKYMKDLKYESFGMGAIDLMYNEVIRDIHNIPLISFYHVKGKNEPVDFNGNYNKDELEKFIADNLGWKDIPKDQSKVFEKEDL